MSTDNLEKIADEAFAAAWRVTNSYIERNGEHDETGVVYINITPTNSPFAEFLRYHYGARKRMGYTGLTLFNPSGHKTPSLRAKEVGANAFADVCIKYGINAIVYPEPDKK
jgi:hypothetical protein